MFCKRLTFSLQVVAALFYCVVLSCSRGEDASGVQRFAILPVENLSSDTNLDWISDAAAAVLAYDLAGPKDIHPVRTAALRDARAKRATRYVEAWFAMEHGALAFHVTIEDPGKVRAVRTLVVNTGASGIAGAMNQLAKELNGEARQLSGCDESALQTYGQSLQGRVAWEPAMSATGCVALGLDLAQALLDKGDRAGAAQAADAVLALTRIDAIDRAQAEYLKARATADVPTRLEALQRLAALLPSDAELQRTTATMQLSSHQAQASVRSWEWAIRADPGDPASWNELGYARAYNHDLEGARKALEQYRAIVAGTDWNVLDSLGEVSFYSGDFATAEQQFLAAHKAGNAPVELLKAAEARMMTGDLAGADALFARHPNWSPIEHAEWEFITGRRKQAISRLEGAASDRVSALQLALWKAQTGQGPAPHGGDDPVSRALSMILAGQFTDVPGLLEPLYRETPPGSDGLMRTLLAWSYARLGRPQDAAKLLDLYPIPMGGNSNLILTSLVFPRFVQLRAEILHSEKDQKLASQYAGDLPDRVQ